MQSSNKNRHDAIVKTIAVNVFDSPIAKTKHNIAKGNNVLIINFTIIKNSTKFRVFHPTPADISVITSPLNT
jgi:hypothetical protein|tara:strand:- start:6500 stop:6715 length:216 start_codon:yes stop_codon:yes gene_type:complete